MEIPSRQSTEGRCLETSKHSVQGAPRAHTPMEPEPEESGQGEGLGVGTLEARAINRAQVTEHFGCMLSRLDFTPKVMRSNSVEVGVKERRLSQ